MSGRNKRNSEARNGSRPPAPPPASLARFRHAEEVELADGVTPPRMSSTTGRRFRPAAEGASTQPTGSNPSTPDMANAARSGLEERTCLDNYGFRVTALEKAAEDRYNRENALPASSVRVWETITRDKQSWEAVSVAKRKALCREGIPDPLRGKVWQLMLGTYGSSTMPGKKGKYSKLRDKPLDSQDVAGVIDRDLDRTFPTHHLFEAAGPKTGQVMLRNILRAYANYNPLVGYCQGMGFLAATLLLQLEREEDTFWALCALMESPPYQFEGLYEPGFPQLRCCFFVLDNLLNGQSKELRNRFATCSIDPSFFATHWFLTAFTYYLNFSLVCRIWDMFLCEGWKPIYRVALALLLLDEKNLMAQPGESELLMELKNIQEDKEPVKLLKTALKVKFKTKQVNKLTKKFRAM